VWTLEEEAALKRAIKALGGKALESVPDKWERVARRHDYGRKAADCEHRWQLMLSRPRSEIPFAWTREEETTLLRLVVELGAKKWEDVAERLDEAAVADDIRTASECEERWRFISAQGCPETDRETLRLSLEKYVAGQRKFALAGKSFDADAVFDDLVSHLEDDLEDDDSCKKNVQDMLLLSVKPSNAAPILAAGAVSPLVELLSDDVVTIKLCAAGALANLSAHKPAARVEIGSAAIVPLIAIVREVGRADTLGHAPRALASLSANADNKVAMVEAGCLDALVGVLRRGQPAAKLFAAMCLQNLSTLDLATKDAIASAGALEPLVALALGGADGADAKRAKSHATQVLANLAFHPEVKPQIAVEKAKVSLKIAMAEASKAQRELSMSAAAAREGRESRMLRESEKSSLEARVYELEAANASLERCLGWMAGATLDGEDAAAHRDKRAKMEAADEATTCVVCRDRPRSLVLLPCAHACLCSACATSIQATSKSCPICRATIAKTTAFRLA
jgi:hypothetical protein